MQENARLPRRVHAQACARRTCAKKIEGYPLDPESGKRPTIRVAAVRDTDYEHNEDLILYFVQDTRVADRKPTQA